MSSTAGDRAADSCYRHPDRQSWVLCQRCGRTICGECQTQAAVGVHCPECTREARQSAPRTKSRVRMAFSSRSGAPVATYTLIAINVALFIPIILSGGAFNEWLAYRWDVAPFQPWRFVTSMFAHSGIFHILFNMYLLYLVGSALEATLGRARFVALYFIGGLGGLAGATVLALGATVFAPGPALVGASGAVFGLFAAYFLVERSFGRTATQILVLIAINFAIGFFFPNISWQGHLGGLVFGALVTLVLLGTRHRRQRAVQIAGLAAIAIVAIVLAVFWYVV